MKLSSVNKAIDYINRKGWIVVNFRDDGAMVKKSKQGTSAFCSWEEMIGITQYDPSLEHREPKLDQPKSLDELDNPEKYRW